MSDDERIATLERELEAIKRGTAPKVVRRIDWADYKVLKRAKDAAALEERREAKARQERELREQMRREAPARQQRAREVAVLESRIEEHERRIEEHRAAADAVREEIRELCARPLVVAVESGSDAAKSRRWRG